MKESADLWIDHREAVKEPYEASQVPADDLQQSSFTGRLNSYYDKVIMAIGNVKSILIFGPGEAKDLNFKGDIP